jgi:hypothetical protein
MGAASRKTLGAAGTQINMHENNTQDSGVITKGWGKSIGTRVGILVNTALGHRHVIKPNSIKVQNEFLMADTTTAMQDLLCTSRAYCCLLLFY